MENTVFEKMTIVEKFTLTGKLLEAMSDMTEGTLNEEVLAMQAFIQDRLELEENRKHRKSKATVKKAQEYEVIEDMILQVLVPEQPVQVSQVCALLQENFDKVYNTQKITPRLKALVKDEKVTTVKGKKSVTLYCLKKVED